MISLSTKSRPVFLSMFCSSVKSKFTQSSPIPSIYYFLSQHYVPRHREGGVGHQPVYGIILKDCRSCVLFRRLDGLLPKTYGELVAVHLVQLHPMFGWDHMVYCFFSIVHTSMMWSLFELILSKSGYVLYDFPLGWGWWQNVHHQYVPDVLKYGKVS